MPHVAHGLPAFGRHTKVAYFRYYPANLRFRYLCNMRVSSENGIKVERNLARALRPFIIKAALPHILTWLEREGVRVAFSDRKSRTLGYYMPPKAESSPLAPRTKGFDGLHTISLQIDLNPYALLFVFVHEWAHLTTRKQFGDEVYPHGREWKNNFKRLFQPFFSPEIFPPDILKVIERYFVKTSRYFETEMETACHRYGKNRKEFAKTYQKLLKKGIVIPAPYMGEQTEHQLEILQQTKRQEELKQQILEKKASTSSKDKTPKARYLSAGNGIIADAAPGTLFRMEDTEYQVIRKEGSFVLAQNLATGKPARIHGMVAVEFIEETD